jgi:hypothetical protein
LNTVTGNRDIGLVRRRFVTLGTGLVRQVSGEVDQPGGKPLGIDPETCYDQSASSGVSLTGQRG